MHPSMEPLRCRQHRDRAAVRASEWCEAGRCAPPTSVTWLRLAAREAHAVAARRWRRRARGNTRRADHRPSASSAWASCSTLVACEAEVAFALASAAEGTRLPTALGGAVPIARGRGASAGDCRPAPALETARRGASALPNSRARRCTRLRLPPPGGRTGRVARHCPGSACRRVHEPCVCLKNVKTATSASRHPGTTSDHTRVYTAYHKRSERTPRVAARARVPQAAARHVSLYCVNPSPVWTVHPRHESPRPAALPPRSGGPGPITNGACKPHHESEPHLAVLIVSPLPAARGCSAPCQCLSLANLPRCRRSLLFSAKSPRQDLRGAARRAALHRRHLRGRAHSARAGGRAQVGRASCTARPLSGSLRWTWIRACRRSCAPGRSHGPGGVHGRRGGSPSSPCLADHGTVYVLVCWGRAFGGGLSRAQIVPSNVRGILVRGPRSSRRPTSALREGPAAWDM